jgi:hypothetical protein
VTAILGRGGGHLFCIPHRGGSEPVVVILTGFKLVSSVVGYRRGEKVMLFILIEDDCIRLGAAIRKLQG